MVNPPAKKSAPKAKTPPKKMGPVNKPVVNLQKPAPPTAKKRRVRNRNPRGVIVKNEDGTVSSIPGAEVAKLKKVAAASQIEKIIALTKPNTVTVTSSDFPVGNDLNWQAVFEALYAAHIASTAVQPPIGPAVIKAYHWWFLIDLLRKVGGVAPEPNPLTVPIFPQNNAIFSGWAKFCEYLMPYRDRETKTLYQFQYNYIYGIPAGNGIPATTSAVMNPSAPPGDFSYSEIQNFFLVPSPPVVPGSPTEMTWTFVNNAFNFQTQVVSNANDISQWISSNGSYTEARTVPLSSPDASACAIPYYGTGSVIPGVYCNSDIFDAEMACILHPPQTSPAAPLTASQFFNIVPFDWHIQPLPQVFNSAPSKAFPAGSTLACPGQLELLLSYGYIWHNTHYSVGKRQGCLQRGQAMWPGLSSYCPLYYPLNDMNYKQCIRALIQTIGVGNTNPPPAVGAVQPGTLTDSSDYMTIVAYCESKKLARVTEFAYIGLILSTTDDVVSQTQYGTEFRTMSQNPAMEDMLDVWAPTVRCGRMTVYYNDYRPVTQYGFTYNANLAGVNVNVNRWVNIGDNFASINGNINNFSPQILGAYQGYDTGPWVFNMQQTGSVSWVVRGPGQITGSPNFSLVVNSGPLGITTPMPVTYALGNTVGPLVPCVYAARIINKTMELFGDAGLGTWATFNYAALGGYVNQAQVNAFVQPDIATQGTTTALNYVTMNYRIVQTKVGSYFPLDKESVCRIFAYCPRLGINNSVDRFPSTQNVGGNSAVQDALIANTQMGPNSNYNRSVQAKLGMPGMDNISAARAVLGAMHLDIVPNFAGDEYLVWQVIEIILRCRKRVTVAPYHSESSSSLTSYNSPNFISEFLGSLFDIGDRVVRTVGGLVGGVASGGTLLDFASNVASNYLSSKFPMLASVPQKKKPAVPAAFKSIVIVPPPRVDTRKLLGANLKSVAISQKEIAKLSIVHQTLPPPEPDYGEIANRVSELMLARKFTRSTSTF